MTDCTMSACMGMTFFALSLFVVSHLISQAECVGATADVKDKL